MKAFATRGSQTNDAARMFDPFLFFWTDVRERGVRFGSLWFALLLHMSSEPGERMTLHILRREGGVAKMQKCKIAKKCRIAEFIGTHRSPLCTTRMGNI